MYLTLPDAFDNVADLPVSDRLVIGWLGPDWTRWVADHIDRPDCWLDLNCPALIGDRIEQTIEAVQAEMRRTASPVMIAQVLLGDTEHLIIAIGVASEDALMAGIEAGQAAVRRRFAH